MQRMMRNTDLVRGCAALAATVLLVTGCGGDGGGAGASQSAPTSPPSSSVAPLVLTPTAELDGTRRHESDGISILVPQGWELERTEDDEFVVLSFYDPQDPRNPVSVTVSTEAADQGVADALSLTVAANLGMSGATDIEQHPAAWEGWDYATAVTGTFDQGDQGEVVDFLAVTVVSASGTAATVTAQAPEGTFEGSRPALVLASLEPSS